MAGEMAMAARRWLLPAACLLLVPAARAQEIPEAPSFPSEASAITVDVVVLDERGQPVRGLTRDDFVIREDGREQDVVGFEARDVDTADSLSRETVAPEVSQVTTDNAAPPGRVLALLLDDLGMSPPVASELKPALTAWIRERADPRDEITIMTTSGDLWWSDVVGRGRSDLLAVLDRLDAKNLGLTREAGEVTAWEGYQILFVESDRILGNPRAGFVSPPVLGRVLQRWYDRGLCDIEHDPVERCHNRIVASANAAHHAWRVRAESVYGAVGRLSRGLRGVRGRKSILLVSEEFMLDSSVDRPFRDAIDASQRANTAVYFLGARGLTGPSAFSASQALAARPRDIGLLSAEEGVLSAGGAQSLADATGGALTVSNDLAAGLERMARDSTTYYLLGYQPESPPDGKWHDLEVEVHRPGSRVLARKGYVATRPEDLAREEERRRQDAEKGEGGSGKSERPLVPTLLAGAAREGLPLRLAAYVRNNDGVSKARVQLVVEIDNSRVRIDRVPTPWRATLDLTILAAGLDRPPLVPTDERLHLSLSPSEAASGWWLVPREVWLPAGVTQLRVFVKDVLSGLSGLATLRLVVPDVAAPYLSTPLLTDRALPARSGERAQLVPTARRSFGGRRPLYCEYEVFTFGGYKLRGVPRLLASYILQGPDGLVVSADQPTLIETDGERAVRRIVLPTEGLDDGPHNLVIHVEDRLAGRTLAARVPFVIEREGGQPAPEGR
jgi:VWFA-related protein